MTGQGENLYVTFELAEGAIAAVDSGEAADVALAAALTDDATFTVDGVSYTAGDEFALGTGSTDVVVSIEITFPFGSAVDNSTQGGNVTFDDFSITVTQVPVP